jgi:hypothetical protein
MPTVKAYLDNNIVSAIAKDDLPAESEALDRLLKAMDEGKVQLVTSELTLQEIEKYQGGAASWPIPSRGQEPNVPMGTRARRPKRHNRRLYLRQLNLF